MKTTLNPFENAKRTAQGTGGISPSVIEEIQGEISVLGSQNETQAQDITDIKGSLNSINDNLTDGIGGTTDKFRFGTDGNGNYGYIKKVEGADTFFPFSSIKMEKGDVLRSQDAKYNVYNNEIEFKGSAINFFICSRGCTNMQKKVGNNSASAIHGWGFKPNGTYERIDDGQANTNFNCSAYDFMDLVFTGQDSTTGVKLKLT